MRRGQLAQRLLQEYGEAYIDDIDKLIGHGRSLINLEKA